jgi:hypothetical protein
MSTDHDGHINSVLAKPLFPPNRIVIDGRIPDFDVSATMRLEPLPPDMIPTTPLRPPNHIDTMNNNNKTTTWGLIGAVGLLLTALSALFDGDPATNPDWPTVLSALVAAIGTGAAFFNARDAD